MKRALMMALAFVPGCTAEPATQPGRETGPCDGGLCLEGLACLSDLCVDPQWSPGSSGGHGGTGDASADSGGPDFAVDGDFFVALPLSISPDTPLQFMGTITADAESVSMVLTPLSLDVLSVDSPREPVPPAVEWTGTVGAGGAFSIPVQEMSVWGSANPITGSDIVASVSIEGVLGEGIVCGELDGEFTVPTTTSLTGSRFEAVEIEPGTPTQDLPLPDDIGCP